MAQKLVSIDIRDDLVCGMMLQTAAKKATVIGCTVAVVEEEGRLSESIAGILDHLGYDGEPCRIAFAPETCFFRNLFLPFHDKRKIDKILPIELEDSVIVDIDDVLVDALVTGKKAGRSAVVAALVERDYISSLLDELKALGLDPEIVTIASVQTALQLSKTAGYSRFVLVDVGCRRATLYVMLESQMRLIRSFAFDDGTMANFSIDRNSQQVSAKKPDGVAKTLENLCRQIRHTLYALEDVEPDVPIFLTGPLADVRGTREYITRHLGCDVLSCDLTGPNVQVGPECGVWRSDLMTSALALALRSGKKQVGFNFRKGEFRRQVSLERYRRLLPRLGIPVAIVLVAVLAYLWNDYNLRQKRLDELEQQGRAVFTETLPEVSRIVDPVSQLQVEIREMKEGALGDAALESDLKILDLMAEISMRIPQSINVHVVRMVADRNSVLLRGMTDNFNSVDTLKKLLEKSGYFAEVTINSANLATRSSAIRFELRLELRRS